MGLDHSNTAPCRNHRTETSQSFSSFLPAHPDPDALGTWAGTLQFQDQEELRSWPNPGAEHRGSLETRRKHVGFGDLKPNRDTVLPLASIEIRQLDP